MFTPKTIRHLALVPLLLCLVGWTRPGQQTPSAVTLADFFAISGEGVITLDWVTAYEQDHLGFRVFRSLTSELEDAEAISPLINAENNVNGAEYDFEDTAVTDGVLYYYWLELVPNGNTESDFSSSISATTLGGAPISTIPAGATSTPVPTTVSGTATPQATSVATATSGLNPGTSTATPQSTATAQPIASATTIAIVPTNTPNGPLLPTPTRFTFPPTATVAANSNPSISEGNESAPLSPTQVVDGSDADTATITDIGGNGGSGSTTNNAESPGNGNTTGTGDDQPDSVAVLGQEDSMDTPLSPPTSDTTTTPAPRTMSPIVIMFLLVGLIFTAGGVFTTLVLLKRR